MPLATPLAIAVSGGADSMALLLMAQAWAQAQNGKAIALTVDHGLRPEAAQEAQLVKDWCRGHGIEHYVLRIQDSGFRIQGRVQEAAREARYTLLTDWCKAHGVSYLLTAHHRDDQAETLFFRLARGSGIEGLACMPAESSLRGVRLLRPLLNVPKSALKAYLEAIGQPWIEDPSNRNPNYTRNRIRAAIAACEDPENISRRAADLASRFRRIRTAMEQELERRLPQVINFTPDGGFLHLDAFLQLPPVYALKTLSLLAQKLGKRPYPPRSEKLARLHDDIKHGRIHKRRSFGGLLFIARKNGLLIRREPKVLEKSDTALHM